MRGVEESCEVWREALSARLDDEPLPVSPDALDEHLAKCEACMQYAADLDAVHRSTRLRTAEPVPDLTDLILEQSPVPASPAAPATVPPSPLPIPISAGSPRSPGRQALILGAIAAAFALIVGIGWQVAQGDPAEAPDLQFASAYATTAPGGDNASVYLSLTNEGGPDDLVSVDTTVAERTTLHGSQARDGYVVMSDRDEYPVPANATVSFQPGGAHVMLEGLGRPLEPGDEVPLTLRFAHAPDVAVTAKVVPLNEIVDLVGFDPSATAGNS